MSILPNKSQGSTSSSSYSPPSLSPNFQHGHHNHHHQNQPGSQSQSESPPSLSPDIHAFGSFHIAPIAVSANALKDLRDLIRRPPIRLLSKP